MTREEAIDIIRKNIPHLGIGAAEMTDALEELIPELRESEDERTRNEIIAFIEQAIHRGGGTPIPKEKEDKWLAYLERQKEPKRAPDDLQNPFEAGQTIIVNNQEQYGLCKKAEWSKEDERMLESVIWHLRYSVNNGDIEHTAGQLEFWLKSLHHQLKPEVTDEEIEEMVTKRSRSSGTTKSEMAFYRNGIKDAIKRFGLRPSWKIKTL